jgi:hypothetical protein
MTPTAMTPTAVRSEPAAGESGMGTTKAAAKMTAAKAATEMAAAETTAMPSAATAVAERQRAIRHPRCAERNGRSKRKNFCSHRTLLLPHNLPPHVAHARQRPGRALVADALQRYDQMTRMALPSGNVPH